jgi:hypothetical protein
VRHTFAGLILPFFTMSFAKSGFAKDILPISADTLHWLISEDEAGGRYFSVFNNEGNLRNISHGDTLLPEADRVITITLKEPADLSILKCSSDAVTLTRCDDCTYRAMIPGAGFMILKY